MTDIEKVKKRLLARQHYAPEQGMPGLSYWGPHDPDCIETLRAIEELEAELQAAKHLIGILQAKLEEKTERLKNGTM